MSTKAKMTSNIPGVSFIKKVKAIEEYQIDKNGLTILYMNRPGTGIITTNITYKVGARDEQVGETGLAHMLEHMLFKPTKQDIKRKSDSGAMDFERRTGCRLNANTWKDRTTYFFSYPAEHFKDALRVESERMLDTVITEKSLAPEKNNVLSEFDMYNGQADFALAATMLSAAFHSHPYGHETIGFREDIEDYTAEKLDAFYKKYYRPDNATLMIVGDIQKDRALAEAVKYFGTKKNPASAIQRLKAREPRQEGQRRTIIERELSTQTLAIGFKHGPFPQKSWYETDVLLSALTETDESILHKVLVDSGKASSVNYFIEPTSEVNLGYIYITAPVTADMGEIESEVLATIRSLQITKLNNLTKKAVARKLTQEHYSRDGSLPIVRELTEYVSAGDWTMYYKTPKVLSTITAKDLVTLSKTLFGDDNLTIGLYKNRS